MDDITKRKLLATGKVIAGGARMVSGVATAFGIGVVGTFLKSRHMQTTALQLGRMSVEGGNKMVNSGLRELQE